MNTSSFFIPNKALFGSYPSYEALKELEANGVKTFVNLTEADENLTPYNVHTDNVVINYPIKDRKIPRNTLTFSLLIIKIHNIIQNLSNNDKIYVHCRGGHGRAGIFVACYLCYSQNISPEDALKLTTEYHSCRKEMRTKWRQIGSPQTRQQKHFVMKMFEPLYFYKAYKHGPTVGFSNFSNHPVYLEELNVKFLTAEAAYHALKFPNNKEFIDKISTTKNPFVIKDFCKKYKLPVDWNEHRLSHMLSVLQQKFTQNENIQNVLINTNLRPIKYHTKHDKFWGDGYDDADKDAGKDAGVDSSCSSQQKAYGENNLGKILTYIRMTLLNNLLI